MCVEVLVEQGEALGIECRNWSRDEPFTNEFWAVHCKKLELRPPQYYEEKWHCLSNSETAWLGALAMLNAESFKQGYVESSRAKTYVIAI